MKLNVEVGEAKRQLAVTFIIVILLAVGLSGCTSINPDEKKILGEWLLDGIPEGEKDSLIFNFFSNGTFSTTYCIDENSTEQTMWGTYTIADEALALTIEEDYTVTFDYSFSDNDNILTLTNKDGVITVYIRQNQEAATKFIGTWKTYSHLGCIIFYDNGTIKSSCSSPSSWLTYRLEKDKIYIMLPDSFCKTIPCFNYEFSDDCVRLTLLSNEAPFIVLTKCGQ